MKPATTKKPSILEHTVIELQDGFTLDTRMAIVLSVHETAGPPARLQFAIVTARQSSTSTAGCAATNVIDVKLLNASFSRWTLPLLPLRLKIGLVNLPLESNPFIAKVRPAGKPDTVNVVVGKEGQSLGKEAPGSPSSVTPLFVEPLV